MHLCSEGAELNEVFQVGAPLSEGISAGSFKYLIQIEFMTLNCAGRGDKKVHPVQDCQASSQDISQRWCLPRTEY